MCCDNIWCAGNGDHEADYPNIQCELRGPQFALRKDAHEINAYDLDACCEKKGLCIGNDDQDAEPDIECPRRRPRVDDAAEVQKPDCDPDLPGSNCQEKWEKACCACHETGDEGDSYCLPTERTGASEDARSVIGIRDYGVRDVNSCTDIMRYAGCDPVACRTDVPLADGVCDGDYEECTSPSFRNGNAQLPAGKSCGECQQEHEGDPLT
eukprot:COSAG04_NODE_6636_length_1287_cov_1.628788_1_plen_209_part_10